MIHKLAHSSNIAVSKDALMSQTIGWEETPQVQENREQSRLLRRRSRVQLDQTLCYVCLVLSGDKGGGALV